MSIRLVSLVWRADRADLPVTDRIVLLRLCDRAADDGSRVYPAVESVARDCGLTRRAVQGALRRLRDAGLLVAVGATTGGRSNPTRYRIDVDRLTELGNRARGAPFEDEERAHVVRERAHVVREKGARGAPDTSVNRHETSSPLHEASLRVSPRGDKPKSRSRIPHDFDLTPQRVTAAITAVKSERGFAPTPDEVALRFEMFRNFHEATADVRAWGVDWDARWRRWAVENCRPARASPSAPPPIDASADELFPD